MTQNFQKITEEPPALPLVGTHILNAPLFERKFARVYFDTLKCHEVQIAKGARDFGKVVLGYGTDCPGQTYARG